VILTSASLIFFLSIQDSHPVFEDETHRNILARHVGVDAFSCFVVAALGYQARHIVQDLVDAALGRKQNAMPVAYEQRMFTYQPEAARITLFFFAYQVKNTYDTIVWNDGIEFILHHILTLFTAWGALAQGSAHFYVPFYFGVSEVSTAVLCLLANFDDVHGVPGMADAFPVAKAVLGGIFAVLFVICRVFMWSTVSYYYCRDAWNALSGSDPRLKGRVAWLRFTFVSLALLSLLQIIWLAEIARVGKMELEKLGLL
jgi:TLC domain